jgi:outer membrane protein OmpA-like peptidoglycan-associated protein
MLNSADLTADGRAMLDELAATLKELGFVSGTVTGYSDSSGAEDYNRRLSLRRAETVAGYLEDRGVAPGRLQVRGMGESDPIADNSTAEGRAMNRRVVISRTDCDKD